MATHGIVIVGGGAGGLELATGLSKRFNRSEQARVTLVDRERTHLWKPLLHEVAAGSMDVHQHQLDYPAQARWYGFNFACGALQGLDRARREIMVAPIVDEHGQEVIPQRRLPYDTLVIAIGGITNSFGVPGVREYAYALDSAGEADRFHQALINEVMRANYGAAGADDVLSVVIVGGGATGVELAAELHNTTRVLAAYGLRNIDPAHQLRFTLINADSRILPMLPERIAQAGADILRSLGVEVVSNEQVVEVRESEVVTRSGRTFSADLTVWAAGIKGPDLLHDLDGLESNAANQLVVHSNLQTTRDPNIFALGDCAACPWLGRNRLVPPRAQVAHQQARHLVRSIEGRLQGRQPKPWKYHDFGSLVSLGEYSTVGTLMGFLSGRSLRVEGWFARLMYESLYKQHLIALYGPWRVALQTLARMLRRGAEPRVKLH